MAIPIRKVKKMEETTSNFIEAFIEEDTAPGGQYARSEERRVGKEC